MHVRDPMTLNSAALNDVKLIWPSCLQVPLSTCSFFSANPMKSSLSSLLFFFLFNLLALLQLLNISTPSFSPRQDQTSPATPWLTCEPSQSAPMYKRASLVRLTGYPGTTVVLTKHMARLLLKTMGKHFGAVQVDMWVWIHAVLFTSCAKEDGAICLLVRGQFAEKKQHAHTQQSLWCHCDFEIQSRSLKRVLKHS